MGNRQMFQNTIQIRASSTVVERCFTDLQLMHRWLNPALRCEPVGEIWSTEKGSRSHFIVNIPLWQPSLNSTVIERAPGLVIWAFHGFFKGQDRWECTPIANGTELLNRFEFEVPNPIVQLGFNLFAAKLTQNDMEAQMQRLKQVAERL